MNVAVSTLALNARTTWPYRHQILGLIPPSNRTFTNGSSRIRHMPTSSNRMNQSWRPTTKDQLIRWAYTEQTLNLENIRNSLIPSEHFCRRSWKCMIRCLRQSVCEILILSGLGSKHCGSLFIINVGVRLAKERTIKHTNKMQLLAVLGYKSLLRGLSEVR